jgi:hypothetical protein
MHVGTRLCASPTKNARSRCCVVLAARLEPILVVGTQHASGLDRNLTRLSISSLRQVQR